MALSIANRLKQRQDFSRIYQRGRRYRSQHLTLRVLRQPDDSVAVAPEANSNPEPGCAALKHLLPTRLGVAISLKVSKRAVIRNRIKRQIHACFRTLLPQLAPGWDLVIGVHPQAVECDYGQFLRELEQLLRDAEVCDGSE